MENEGRLLQSTRRCILIFVVGLILSGLTAFPLVHETRWLAQASRSLHLDAALPGVATWILRVNDALEETAGRYPYLAYGTDWLAFAHLVIAVAFWGPYRDPSRNRWVITFGLIACAGILPLTFIAGPLRGIPFFWRCMDASFGVFGSIPLWIARARLKSLDQLSAQSIQLATAAGLS